MKVAVPMAKNVLAPLATMASAFAIDGATQRKMRGQGVRRAGKGITLVISNKGMDDIIKIIKSLENSDVFLDGVGETVKHEIKKKQEWGYLRMLFAFLGTSIIGNMLTGERVRKGEKGYNNMDHIDKKF